MRGRPAFTILLIACLLGPCVASAQTNTAQISIQEFKIQKSQYPAEFGGKASALINVATKSGTNEYHGTLFEFLRNDIFDAKNFFDDPNAPVPPLRLNQFGGTTGGPLVRNKTFFFLNYEGQRTRKSITKTFTVPTGALRRGDFSSQPAIYDPLSTDLVPDAVLHFSKTGFRRRGWIR